MESGFLELLKKPGLGPDVKAIFYPMGEMADHPGKHCQYEGRLL